MNKFKIVVLPIALVIWVGMNMLFIQYSRDSYQELQKKKLDIIVNYAVDAATDELVLNTANLGLDYADFEKMEIEPGTALDIFCTVFLKSHGMSTSKENYTLVKTDYLAAFAVAAYDGYYIAKPTKINSSGAYDAIFSIKQPYMYKNGPRVFALNLGLEDAKLYDGNSLQKVVAPITKEEQKAIINSNVSDSLMSTVYEQKEGKMFSTIYVPSNMTTITRTNPIENVTVMAYITNVDTGYGSLIETFGIGGARVTHEQFVGCYIKNGSKYYTYIKYIPLGMNVIETFENPIIAAQNGYYFDSDYFTN